MATNNQAEVLSLWQGTNMIVKKGIVEVLILGDTRIIIKAFQHKRPLKNSSLAGIQTRIMENMKRIPKDNLLHILKAYNNDADSLDNKGTQEPEGSYIDKRGTKCYETIP